MLENIGVIDFMRKLSARQKLAVVVSVTIGGVTAVLDAVALAMIVPTVQFMVGFDDSARSSDAIRWFRGTLDFLGVPFTLTSTLVFVIITAVLRSVFLLLGAYVSTQLRAGFEARIRIQLYSSVMVSTWSFILRQRAGAVQNALMVECERAGNALGALLSALATLLSVGIYVFIALTVSWQLTLVTLVGTGILFFAFRILTKISHRLGIATSSANAELATEISEGLAGAKVLKAHAEETTIERMQTAAYRRARVETLTGINNGVFTSSSEFAFTVLLLGGLLIATRMMDLDASVVLLFSLLFFRLFQRTRALQSTVMDFNTLVPAMDIVADLIQEASTQAERKSGARIPAFTRGIEFQEVSFGYDSRNQILNSINLSIQTGSTVAMVGASGSGKTTVLDLTIGLLTPNRGDITVDDESLSSLDVTQWRSNLAYVSQDTVLLNDTIAANIAWGRNGVNHSEIRRAAKLTYADDFIERMPDGYETVVGERGMGISGGQRQRLALARALVRNPKLLILDEATSELDSESEARIQSTLDSLHGKLTVLMAAHRLSTVLNADTVYVIQNGQIAEFGRPSDLLAGGGIFHQLYAQEPRSENNETISQL